MDNSQSMPAMSALVKETFTRREWLNYYLNIWQRNIAARIIDVESDRILKAVNPETMVELDANQPEVAVKVRYEIRKQNVKDARAIIEATKSLLAKTDEELELLDSDDALKVSEDMLPPPAIPAEKLPTEEEIAKQAELDKQSAPAEVGAVCTTEAGKAGTWQSQEGVMVCVEDAVDASATGEAATV